MSKKKKAPKQKEKNKTHPERCLVLTILLNVALDAFAVEIAKFLPSLSWCLLPTCLPFLFAVLACSL